MFISAARSRLFAQLWSLGGLSPLALLLSALPAHAQTQTVNIQFQAMVGDSSFLCGVDYANLGSDGRTMTATDFRFYVSDVALITPEGETVPVTLAQDGRWQYENVALLDFEDKTGACTNGTTATNTVISGTIPEGEYTGLAFTLGVPFALNHADATLAPSPLNLTSMWWNWQGGYKFLRIDLDRAVAQNPAPQSAPAEPAKQHPDHGQPDATGRDHSSESGHGESHPGDAVLGSFVIHLGSTGCQLADGAQVPTHCHSPNLSRITLPDFNPAENVVVADLAALVAATNLSENWPDTAVGCMSGRDDMDCVGIFQQLGIPFGERSATPEQSFFTIK
jgi:hypothetical protein